MTGPRTYNPGVAGAPMVMLDPYRIPAAYRGLARDAFALGQDFQPLAANGSDTRDIQVNEDAAFCIVAAVGVCTDTLNTTRIAFVPQVVQLQEGSAQRNLFNRELHWHEVFGTAENPCYWPQPKVIPKSSTFVVQLRNLEAIARNVFVAFWGFKIFPVIDE